MLPPAWLAAIDEFCEHLRYESRRSEHTVRAYRTDIAGLAAHANRYGVATPAELTLETLRSWLAAQASRSVARATLARRAAAVRTFTAWLMAVGIASGTTNGASAGTSRGGAEPFHAVTFRTRSRPSDACTRFVRIAPRGIA